MNSPVTIKTKVMIAGIGGASLGTELLKSLQLANRYEVFGCDISPKAYGMYDPGFLKTYLVDEDNYIDTVVSACKDAGVTCVIPGGEQPMVLLGKAVKQLQKVGLKFVSNTPEVIETCSDKSKTFHRLAEKGIPIPNTIPYTGADSIRAGGLPCIVKPATGTGGSSMVFLAGDTDEAIIYAEYIARSGSVPLIQEYISVDNGEYTVGVLSLPNGELVGSIALRRLLDAKLSIMVRNRIGVISSGYSQGYIGDFPDIRRQCELIAKTIGSKGPLNIQGRLKNGTFVPFEINPRFSASTYLRAMAGFNEADMTLQYLSLGIIPEVNSVREGWYLRSLTEQYVSPSVMPS